MTTQNIARLVSVFMRIFFASCKSCVSLPSTPSLFALLLLSALRFLNHSSVPAASGNHQLPVFSKALSVSMSYVSARKATVTSPTRLAVFTHLDNAIGMPYWSLPEASLSDLETLLFFKSRTSSNVKRARFDKPPTPPPSAAPFLIFNARAVSLNASMYDFIPTGSSPRSFPPETFKIVSVKPASISESVFAREIKHP